MIWTIEDVIIRKARWVGLPLMDNLFLMRQMIILLTLEK